jgi:ABC-type Fe3+ transport system permease subunit/DNA-binding beta-propeller fold protein YncE
MFQTLAMSWTLIQNSFLVSVGTTALACLIGFVIAVWLIRLPLRWQRIFIGGAVAALVLPPFLVVNCWLDLLGHAGLWRNWLPLNIYSIPGTIWVLTLLHWPIPMLLVLARWRRLDPGLIEIDPLLRSWALLRAVLWPHASSSMRLAAGITFVLALNNFAVPSILQTKVFPAEVWLRFNTQFDHVAALAVSWPMILLPLVLLWWLHQIQWNWPNPNSATTDDLFRQRLGIGVTSSSALVAVAVFALAVVLPLFQLTASAQTWSELAPAFAAGQSAVFHSIFFSATAAVTTILLGLLTWRWRSGWLLWVLFLTPGVLLGIGLILVFNRPWLAAIYQSSAIVVVALTIRYLGFGWSGAVRAMQSVDRNLVDWARLNGANTWQMLGRVHWPQMAPTLATMAFFVYLLSLWDAETLVLILPPGGETLAVRIFNLLHYGHNAQVNALCLILVLTALLPLGVWQCGHRFAEAFARRHVKAGGGALVLAIGLLISATGCSAEHPNAAPVKSAFFSAVQVLGTRGVGLGQFNKPRSLACDAQDNLFVVDMTGRVQKFSPDGRFLSSWQMPQTDKGRPKGMCRDAEGHIVVIEPHYSRVNHFSPEGKLVAQWGVHGSAEGQLMFPRSAAVNSRGEIFVSEYGAVERVQRFTARGEKFLQRFGKAGPGPGEFNRPEGLAVDAQDRIYVADSCNHRMQVFSRDGQFLRAYGSAGSGPGQLSYPYDVRVDRFGFQYVCEFGNSRIQIFDTHDRPVEILGGPGAAPGQFHNPWAIAFDSKGNLYVADAVNHRVQKFIRREGISRSNLASLN